MRQLASTLHRALWFACVCVCLGGSVARASDSYIQADLDGDGLNDLITFDGGQAFVLHVWLSSTAATQTIRSRLPVVRVVATDVDGDHRPEIITRDSAAGLQIWRRGRRGFRSYRPRRIVTGAIGRSNRRQLEDGPSAPPSAVPGQGAPQASLYASAYVCAVLPRRSTWQRPQARAPDHGLVVWNAAPRPPPHASRSL
jgi:hypothetical protein